MGSPPAFAFDTSGLPGLGAYLLVYPEQVDCDVIDEPTYAMVVNFVSATVVSVTTQGNLSFTFDVSSSILAFQRVSVEEYGHVAALGSYVRKAVLLRHRGVYHYGQVRGYDFGSGTLSVRTSIGLLNIEPASLVPVDAPLAMLLFEYNFPAGSVTTQALDAMHDLITLRIVGDAAAGVVAVNDVAEALNGFAPEPGSLVLEWCDPGTGIVAQCGLDHVMRYVCYDGCAVPNNVVLGSNFCDDPAHRPNPDRTRDDAEDFLSPRIKYNGKRRHDRITPPSSKGDTPTLDAFGDLDELLRLHAGMSERLRAAPDLRDYMGAQLAVSDPKPNKFTFDPSAGQQLVFKAMYARPLHQARAICLLEKWAANTRIGFLAYPALLVRLYDFRFGFGGLSIAHFCPRTAADLVSLHGSASIDMSNFSPHTAKLPGPDPVESLSDLRSCVDKLQEFFFENGSPHAHHLMSLTSKFLQEFSTSASSTKRHLKCIVTWINQTFQLYRYELSQDLESPNGYSNRHKKIYLRLNKRHPDLQEEFHEIDGEKDEPCLQPGASAEVTAPKKPRKEDDPKAPREVPSWYASIPRTKGGKSLCARFLSVKGCPSAVQGKCMSSNRVHAWPTKPLDDALVAAITKQWGSLHASVPTRSA